MIIIRIWEGLGNQLFQYAYARNLQERTHNTIFLEIERLCRGNLEEDLSINREYGLGRFSVTIPIANRRMLKKWEYIGRKTRVDRWKWQLDKVGLGAYHFINEGEDMFSYRAETYSRQNYYIMGHFQNVRYPDEIRDILLRELQPKKEIGLSDEFKALLQQRAVVSVHIRRGDYLKHPYLAHENNKMNARDYYGKAITYIREKVDNPVFLFFSDDTEWVKENILCTEEHYYASDLGLQDYEELILMSRCRHNIMGNSTFSFWGAWLNENPQKIVIGPRELSRSIVKAGWILI